MKREDDGQPLGSLYGQRGVHKIGPLAITKLQ
jgi:hypothetical protein